MYIVLMGVSGCGKTAVGVKLSKKIQIPFYDADDFHSTENKEKMSRGIPLTDKDRLPWLHTLSNLFRTKNKCILACSALKKAYRNLLHVSSDVHFVYLKGDYQLIHERLKERSGHFFDASLLTSQFSALEEPVHPEDSLSIDIVKSVDEIVEEICNYLTNLGELY